MKTTNILVIGLAVIIFLTFSTAEEFGYGRSEEIPINYSTIPTVNNSYYLQGYTPQQVANLYSETDPLSIHTDAINTTQLDYDVSDELTIKESWLTSFINSFGFLTSITNIFDQSLNTTDDVEFNSLEISNLFFPTFPVSNWIINASSFDALHFFNPFGDEIIRLTDAKLLLGDGIDLGADEGGGSTRLLIREQLGDYNFYPDYVYLQKGITGNGSGLENVTLNDHLVMHYPLQNDWRDITGNENDLEAIGTVVKEYGVTNFYGSGDYLNTSMSSNLPSGNSTRSIMMWVSPDSWKTNNLFFAYGIGEANKTVAFTFDNSTTMRIPFYGSDTIFNTPQQYAGDWHHVALTIGNNVTTTNYSIEDMHVYFDGVEITDDINTDAVAVKLNTGQEFIRVGGYASGLEFDGHISDVRIYNKKLSNEEILEVMNQNPVIWSSKNRIDGWTGYFEDNYGNYCQVNNGIIVGCS